MKLKIISKFSIKYKWCNISSFDLASGDDHQFTTQKPRKGDMSAAYYSHPATPQSTVPSPGTASINSAHDDNGDINNPNWSRTPASPVRFFDIYAQFYE